MLVESLPYDTKPETYRQINELLAGPRTQHTTMTVDAESGLVPPPWWGGDEEASRSALADLAAA